MSVVVDSTGILASPLILIAVGLSIYAFSLYVKQLDRTHANSVKHYLIRGATLYLITYD